MVFPKGGVRWLDIKILSGVMDVELKSAGSQREKANNSIAAKLA
jgi:hypothetical protein